MPRPFLITFAFFLLGLSVSQAANSGLKVGVARTDITPLSGTETMIGMGGRVAEEYAINDPLMAKVVILESSDEQVALVALDLIWAETKFMAAIRDGIRDETGVENVICALTHSHGSGRPTEDFYDRTLPLIIAAAKQAHQNLEPVNGAYGRRELQEGYNRRAVQSDGTVKMLWNNRDRLPTSPTDDEVGVLTFTSTADDRVIATLVNYSVHPVISMNFDQLIVSADYPGVMARKVEAALGGICVFFLGAAGDVNPFDADMFRYATAPEAFAQVELIGHVLAQKVVEASRSTQFSIGKAALSFEKNVINLADRSAGPGATPTRQVEVNTLVIGSNFALATIPGEPFVELGLELKSHSPLAATWVVANANDYVGYLPTIKATTEGGYGATSGTQLEVGAGEKLIHAAVVSLHHQAGFVKPLE
ncbi:MAG: hypothetical protein HOH58_02820 [Opitutaceae bacterium]|jgi:neutral ceramidase|nr:hypothetical protein [Opitutaceae bacterium]